ncbi:hypothetical protein BDZ91DRAFT_743820 [Kalaharituber pfeilii]|nr:hypothetical protein BDZ91DRAFT_743820 [Kalaharituber pfeilii]
MEGLLYVNVSVLAYMNFVKHVDVQNGFREIQEMTSHCTADGETAISVLPQVFMAAVLARNPVLAVAAADEGLPKINRDGDDANDYSVLRTTLDVKWEWVYRTAAAILVGEIVAVFIVLWYSHYHRTIIVRDVDSILSIARLLNTLTSREEVKNMSLESGVMLAETLDRAAGINGPRRRIAYGTRRVIPGNARSLRVVDLNSDVEQEFPEGKVYVGLPEKKGRRLGWFRDLIAQRPHATPDKL